MAKQKVFGLAKLRRRLRHLQQEAPGIISEEALGGLLLKRMQDRFIKEQAPDGTRWDPLSPSTVKRKRRSKNKVLFQRGHLFNALALLRSGDGVSGLRANTGLGVRIGVRPKVHTERLRGGGSRRINPATYGLSHQLGLDGLPTREFIGLNAGDRTAILAKARNKLRRAAAGR